MNPKALIKISINNLIKEKRSLLANSLLLGIWSYILYSLGDIFFAFLIIVIYFAAVFFRQPSYALPVVSVLAIILFCTPIMDTWMQMRQSSLRAFDLTEIFSPNSGQEVLPTQVRQMLSLLKTHHVVKSYHLSKTLDQDELIKQRITEAAWPIKMDSASHYLFRFIYEKNNNSTCSVIDQREDVSLEYCP